MTAPGMERIARPGEYYAAGRAATAARHLLTGSKLFELVPKFLTVIEHEDQPGLFHLETALVTYGPLDRNLLGFLAALCHTAPPFHSHLHDLTELDDTNRRVVVEAIIIAAGFGSPDCNHWPVLSPNDIDPAGLGGFTWADTRNNHLTPVDDYARSL